MSILLGPHRCVTPRHTGPSPSWDGGIAPACRRQHSARPVVGVWRSNSWRHTAPSPNGAAAPAQSGAPAGRDSELPDLLVDHITPSTRPDSAPRCHDPAPSTTATTRQPDPAPPRRPVNFYVDDESLATTGPAGPASRAGTLRTPLRHPPHTSTWVTVTRGGGALLAGTSGAAGCRSLRRRCARCRGARRCAALGPGGGYLFEERAQGGLLVGVEGREHPLFCAGECMFKLSHSASSGGREADGVTAAVL